MEAAMTLTELKCENLVNPNAIDNTQPHFSWKIQSDRPMQQQAYEIQVASDSTLLKNNAPDLWASGKINSPASVMLPYNGAALTSRSLCYWRVRIWNEKGEVSAWTPVARFGIGILNKNDFQGSFIGLAGVKTPILRKKFTVTSKNTAFLHVNSLGYHEVYINGEKISKDVLSPAVSQFNKHSIVVTYDVTDYLQTGENEIVIWLGQGWYKQSAWDRVDITILDGSVVRAQLDVRQNNAWNTLLITNSSWQGRASGYEDTGSWNALRFGGEKIDAAKNPKDMYPATLDKLTWQPAIVRTAHNHEIAPEMTEPNRIQEKIQAKSVKRINLTTWLVDMGKSVNGWFEWRLPQLPQGQTVTIHYTDDLNNDGTWKEMDGGQADQYIVLGEEGEMFCNKFNHHAFRYVKISNSSVKPELADMNAYLIHTNYQPAATFECSDSDLNAIHNLIQYTMRCLAFAGYMVDCPHLERAGYGGDGNSSTLSLQTMYDAAPLFANWVQAWGDAMREEGSLPHVAPNPGAGGGGPYWCGFIIMAPWQTYVNYNDSRLIEKYYPVMKEWLGYVDKYTVDGLLKRWPDLPYRDWYLGDWLAPSGVDSGNQSSIDLVTNCFISDCFDKMAKIATVLGKPEEAAGFAARREALNQLLHSTYFKFSSRSYATGSQLDMTYPMLVGATPDNMYASVTKQLFNFTDNNHNGHLAAGLVGVPIVTRWAIENKAADFMYAMLKKRDYPGYLYMIDNDATTTWESWDRSRSRIHNCYNGIGSWFYQAVGGIRPDESNPGYRHFFIDPQAPQGITWAKTTKESPYGTIKVDWVLESAAKLKINITVPIGTQGTFIIPGEAKRCKVDGADYPDLSQNIVLESGEHEIVVFMEDESAIPALNQSPSLNVYPNPVDETLYITPENLNIEKICIYDAAGNKVKEMRNVQNSIDLSSIHKGAYLASLETGQSNRLVSKKFKIMKL
ncbi:MAG: family 78 glycoside hydrolase catalytic domain [Dysgonamonadaceae bacterium]|nr:family 78 glycoside hydrolase catalytic domain [Dysgonamonadaceae bacterium]